MTRQRVRIRYRKQGDLRLTSHRDLVRAFERLLRRAQIRLRMSEGFHPKAKMTFFAALALGVRGLNEVMEVELDEVIEPDELQSRLAEQCPPGLEILQIQPLAADARKAKVVAATYHFPIPDSRRPQVATAIEQLLARDRCLVERPGRDPVDIRPGLQQLALDDNGVSMQLEVTGQAGVRPRDVIASLELEDLQNQGLYLTRTGVELLS